MGLPSSESVKVSVEVENKTSAGLEGVGQSLQKSAADYVKTWEAAESARLAAQRARIAAFETAMNNSARAVSGIESESQFNMMEAAGAAFGGLTKKVKAAVGVIKEVDAALHGLSVQAIAAENATLNLEVNIGGARAAFGGLVDDMKLANMANKAFAAGVVDSGAELTILAAGVNVLAAKTGQDATQLFDNAVTSIGKGSAPNLGGVQIKVDQAEAEKIYAESLGKTTTALDAQEKAHAFAYAATMKVGAAAKEAAKTNSSAARSYEQLRVEMMNSAAKVVGFDDRLGKAKDAVRGLSDAQLKWVKDSKYQGDKIRMVNEALEEQAIAQSALVESATDLKLPKEMFLADFDDIKHAASELGLTLDELVDKELSTRDQNRKESAEADRIKREEEALQGKIKALIEEADLLDHDVEILRTAGSEEKNLIFAQTQSLELRREAAVLAMDEAEAIRLGRQIEVMDVKKGVRPSGGGGPSRAEIRKAEEDLSLFRLDAAAKLQQFGINDARSLAERTTQTEQLFGIEQERIDAQRAIAEALPERTKMQQIEKAKALAEVELSADEQRRQQIVATRDLEAQAFELKIAQMDQEIARNRALGAEVGLLAEQRRILAEEQALQFGTMEELASVEYDNETARLTEKKAKEQSEFEDQLSKIDQQMALEEAHGISTEDLALRRIDVMYQQAQAANDTDGMNEALHQRELTRIKAEVAAKQRALQASKQFLQIGGDFAQTIIDSTIKDDKKRERASLRVKGVMAMATGALETVEAVAAFASFNYVQGALHTAAAAFAFTQGGLMLAGNVPGGGGSGSGAGGGGGAEPASKGPTAERETTMANLTPGSMPAGEAAKHSTKSTTQVNQQSGNVINIYGGVHANGAIDGEFAEKIAFKLKEVGQSREGAA